MSPATEPDVDAWRSLREADLVRTMAPNPYALRRIPVAEYHEWAFDLPRYPGGRDLPGGDLPSNLGYLTAVVGLWALALRAVLMGLAAVGAIAVVGRVLGRRRA